MKRFDRLARGLLVLALSLAAPVAFAQSGTNAQTWVSGYGSDTSADCAFATPCRTFQYALGKTAPGGEVSILDPGPFGPVMITRGVTINGVGAYGNIYMPNVGPHAAVYVATTQESDVVILRGLSIKGEGNVPHGIYSGSLAGTLHVENCAILGIGGNGIWFNPAGSGKLFVSNTSIRGNYGVLIQPGGSETTAWVSMNNVRLENNVRGIHALDGSTVVIRNTVATGNSQHGFIAQGSSRPVKMTIENSVASFNGSGNGVGVYALNQATIWVSNSTIMGNAYGLAGASGGTIYTYANNRAMANTFSDSTGTITTLPGK